MFSFKVSSDFFREYKQKGGHIVWVLLSGRVAKVLESNKEQKWLYGWLCGEHHEEEIQQYLTNVAPVLNPEGAVVCVCSVDRELEDSCYPHYLSFFQTIFQSYGLFAFSVIENKQLVFILINLRDDDWKIRVSKALHQIRQTDFLKQVQQRPPLFGVGKYIESLFKLSV